MMLVLQPSAKHVLVAGHYRRAQGQLQDIFGRSIIYHYERGGNCYCRQLIRLAGHCKLDGEGPSVSGEDCAQVPFPIRMSEPAVGEWCSLMLPATQELMFLTAAAGAAYALEPGSLILCTPKQKLAHPQARHLALKNPCSALFESVRMPVLAAHRIRWPCRLRWQGSCAAKQPVLLQGQQRSLQLCNGGLQLVLELRGASTVH